MIIKLAQFESGLEKEAGKEAAEASFLRKAFMKLKNAPKKADVTERRASRWLNEKLGIKMKKGTPSIDAFAKEKFKDDPKALAEYLKINSTPGDSKAVKFLKTHSAGVGGAGVLAAAGGGIAAAKHHKNK